MSDDGYRHFNVMKVTNKLIMNMVIVVVPRNILYFNSVLLPKSRCASVVLSF